jgi:hypothetical protein
MALLGRETSSRTGPIFAMTLGVAVALVLLASVSYTSEKDFDPCAPHSYGPPYFSPPIPICWSLSQLPEYQNPSVWVYPFQVTSVYSGFPLFINNLSFAVQSNAGLDLAFESITIASGGYLLAEYNYTLAKWAFGSADHVEVGMNLTLISASNLTSDDFWVNGESPNGDEQGWDFTLT